uniref:Uncharacterized protein n=1 Tax=Anopheles darlingi TaxID=43151 RepID=A0A2M4DJU0_ANODA
MRISWAHSGYSRPERVATTLRYGLVVLCWCFVRCVVDCLWFLCLRYGRYGSCETSAAPVPIIPPVRTEFPPPAPHSPSLSTAVSCE